MPTSSLTCCKGLCKKQASSTEQQLLMLALLLLTSTTNSRFLATRAMLMRYFKANVITLPLTPLLQ
jgi:hypothetical protein